MSTAILLDGAPATAADWGGLIVSPTVDSVQELQVTRSTYDAQYGRAGGSVINIVSKGGTNELHGLVYDYFRNDNLDANSWVNNASNTPKPEFKRNQFGANLAGPISRNRKVYFFAAYEGLREPFTGSSGFMTVPTLQQRQGDFSETYNAPDPTTGIAPISIIYDPFSTDPISFRRSALYISNENAWGLFGLRGAAIGVRTARKLCS